MISAIFGKSGFEKRTYGQFLADAKIIGSIFDDKGKVKESYKGAKLSWGLTNTPHWDVTAQSVTRAVKWFLGATLGGFSADRVSASENTKEWAEALCDEMQQVQLMETEDDVKIFIEAQKAFGCLAFLYYDKGEKKSELKEGIPRITEKAKVPVKNYLEAAESLEQAMEKLKSQIQKKIILAFEVEENKDSSLVKEFLTAFSELAFRVLTPKEMKTYSSFTKEVSQAAQKIKNSL